MVPVYIPYPSEEKNAISIRSLGYGTIIGKGVIYVFALVTGANYILLQ